MLGRRSTINIAPPGAAGAMDAMDEMDSMDGMDDPGGRGSERAP